MSTLTKINTRRDVNEMPLDDAYFEWLYSQVGSVTNRNLAKTYWTLLRLLHQKEFTWSNVVMDENRAHDGRDLRLEFLRSTGTELGKDDTHWMDYGCSMLELLIALSRKLAFEGEGEASAWFWELVGNLGLDECTDANPPDAKIVNLILDKVVERDYSPNGAGGLFPLENANEDQTHIELWYQANAYLLERI